MKKEEMIKILIKSAKHYNKELLNKNILFLYGDINNPKCLECIFFDRTFHHLTGTNINMSSVNFYRLCVNSKLSPTDFTKKNNGYTEMKLRILEKTMNIHKNAKMLGIYDNSKIYLQTDKLIGGFNSCLGFIQSNYKNYYVPNTLLQEDIRNISEKDSVKPIVAILRKDVKSDVYEEICYVSKRVGDFSKININKLDKHIKIQLPIPELN